jgi:hypothetical protein
MNTTQTQTKPKTPSDPKSWSVERIAKRVTSLEKRLQPKRDAIAKDETLLATLRTILAERIKALTGAA